MVGDGGGIYHLKQITIVEMHWMNERLRSSKSLVKSELSSGVIDGSKLAHQNPDLTL